MPTEINTIGAIAAAARGQRQKLGLSQESVAQRARVSRQWLSEFESGKPRAELQLVMRLLDALGLRLSLEAADETRRGGHLSPSATVDLDALLGGYRQS